MPAFCSLLLPFYYSNNLYGNIDASLKLARFEILLLNNQRCFKNFHVGAILQKYLDGSGGNCLSQVVVIGINKKISARRYTSIGRFDCVIYSDFSSPQEETCSDGIELNGASIPPHLAPHHLRRNFPVKTVLQEICNLASIFLVRLARSCT